MTGLAIPQAYRVNPKNIALARRIGVKFNNKIRPLDVQAYSVAEGWIETTGGDMLRGRVEPFWR